MAAMIEGGGPGCTRPATSGRSTSRRPTASSIPRVADEAAAVAVAQRYRELLRAHREPRPPSAARADPPTTRYRRHPRRWSTPVTTGLQRRRGFGHGIVTALARIGGVRWGIVATTWCISAARSTRPPPTRPPLPGTATRSSSWSFLRDMPGSWSARGGEDRRCSSLARLFVTGANLTVPVGMIVLRKGDGWARRRWRAVQGARLHERLADVGVADWAWRVPCAWGDAPRVQVIAIG